MARDVTDATFQQDVLERSTEVPVVVDLWAPWCGPCRTLGPIIEKVVAATDGKVELVKVNVDENPQISGAFRVQSIPAVYALRDGKVVDGFVGALPEHQVRDWVARLAPAKTEVELLVEAGDEDSLRRALELEPGNADAVVALAELLVGDGDGEGALALLAKVPETADTRRVAALARVGALSEAAASEAAVVSELDGLLPRVKADEDARQRFRDLLELLDDEASKNEYRRKLASRLF